MKKLLQRGFGTHPALGILLCVFNLAGIAWFAHLWQSSNANYPAGGGITSVAVLPGTCTPGTAANVNLTINGHSLGEFYCSNTNVMSPMTTITNSVSPLSYGAKWDVKFLYDCNWLNASSTINCPNEAPFLSTDCQTGAGCTGPVNKIMFGANAVAKVTGCSGATCGSVTVPQGTITGFTNSSTVTISTTTTNSCTPAVPATACTFAWGSADDTAAINSAAVAAWTSGPVCYSLEFPSGAAFFSGQILNTSAGANGNACGGNSTNGLGADMNQAGPTVYGQGPVATTLIPLPTFTYPASGNVIGQPGNGLAVQYHDFGVNGLGNNGNATSNAITLFSLQGSNQCTGTLAYNLALSQWLNTTQNTTGFAAGSCGISIFNISVEMFGATLCSMSTTGGTVWDVGAFNCQGGGGAAGLNGFPLSVGGGGTFNSYSSAFASPLVANTGAVAFSGGTWNSYGDLFGSSFVTQISLITTSGATGTINFDHANFSITGTTAGSTIFNQTTGAGSTKIHLRGSIVNASGANNSMFLQDATSSIFDDGGNTLTNGGVANTVNAAFGFTNSANGTACATGNFALTSGWGTSSVASVAANGNILGCHVTITGAAGAAGPVLTWTYPAAPIVAPGSCHLSGASGTLTGVSTGTPGATTVAFTFTGTPSAQTYNFDVGCP